MDNAVKTETQPGGVNSQGTFEVSVKFMQNNTWQGHIHWIEKNKKQNFRSVLEMLRLMDEALTHGTEDAQEIGW